MTRWLIAVATLVGVAVGLAQAEYVIIVVNVGQGKAPPPPPPPPGGMGPEGGGMVPVDPAGGGFVPPTGRGPGVRPGPGGMPPMGGFPMGGGEDGFGGMPIDDPDPTALYVVTVVETKGTPTLTAAQASQLGKAPVEITHEWGKTVLLPSERIWVTAMPNGPSTLWPSAAKRWRTEYDRFIREVPKDEKPSVDELVNLATLALKYGLLKDCVMVMDKAVEVDKTHSVVAAYIQIKADLEKELPVNKSAAVWKSRLNPAMRTRDGLHYTLLHQATKDDAPEVTSRLDRLEDSFKGFYLWFALKGVVLPMPKERLLAVLVGKPAEFTRIHQTFEEQPLVSDGFHARRDNLTVFSAVRTDEPFTAFAQHMRPHLADKDIKDLLRGNASRGVVTARRENNINKFIQEGQLQTAVLVQRALERDGELATVSHEVPRQLLAGAGLLPRNVAAPEWVIFGIGAFFETPRGAPWSSFGAPGATLLDQYNYLLNYKLWAKSRKLDRPGVQLEKCLGDQYFLAAFAERDEDKAAAALLKARTHAWALTYFLAQTKLKELLAFYRELGQLPRDVEFDGEVIMTAFGRAFGIVDREGKINRTQFDRLADEWHRYMMNTSMDFEDVMTMVRKGLTMLKEGKHPGGNINQMFPGGNNPMGPGGMPMPPGGA